MKTESLPLRPNVCMLVYNRKGRLFLGERCRERGHWQFPQGGVEPKSTQRANVVRELQEELGLKKTKLGKITKLVSRHEYDWKKPPAYARDRWRGQKQTFWLVEFLGDDADIDLETHGEPEFQSWRWCSVAEVRRRVPPYRLAGYSGALREFLAFKRTKLAVKKKPKKRRV